MKSLFGVGILSLSLFLSACEDPAANKVRAVTSESTPASAANTGTAASSAPAAGELLAVTSENSKILFTGSKVTGKHDGGFNKFDGSINLVGAKPQDSSVKVEIETASVFTDADGLTKHLQGGDFFEVEKYPKALFTSTRIVPDPASGPGKYNVTGDLELRGVRKSVTFPSIIKISDADVAVDAEFVINRKDFGIVYAGKADDLIRDDVVIKLELKSPRKK